MEDSMGSSKSPAVTKPAVTKRQPCEIAPAFIDAITPPKDKQRLKQKIADIQNNIRRQTKEVRDYTHKQQGALPDCCKTLHLSLFFDGTNNHRIPDVDGHTLSNVARLYRATIGPDPASETATSPAAQEPTGLIKQVNKEGYYAHYASGIGTVFEPVNDNTPNQNGLMGAYKGEARINWMLTRVVDTLYSAFNLDEQRPTFAETRNMVEAMDTGSMWTYPLTQIFVDGAARRKEQIELLLNNPELQEKLAAQQQPKGSSEQPKILSMRLYVYGFSRGAAEARTFSNWLQELLAPGKTVSGENCLTLAGIPVIIEFLGLFDTVPAVGFANSIPLATGHMAWADFPYMRIPDNQDYVKKCLHLVAAHEQRASFAVDSIRRGDLDANGKSSGPSVYRRETKEYVYPGVHSDIGGGYAPNDQGKGLPDKMVSYDQATNKGKEYRYYGYNLSQLPLHHMYREAFECGAPLQIDRDLLPKLAVPYNQQTWRNLLDKSINEFGVQEELLQHFNAWRTYASSYDNQPVEDILRKETALITAWRISRYNPANTKEFNFFKRLPEDVSKEYWDAAARVSARKTRLNDAQRKADEQAAMDKEKKTGKEPDKPLTYQDILSDKEYKKHEEDLKVLAKTEPTITEAEMTPYKVYEPMLDRRQTYRGALDFYSDYDGTWDMREDPAWEWMDMIADGFSGLLYLLNEEDEAQEYIDILTDGKKLHKEIFIAGTEQAQPEYADVIKLFDNQLHDSRAWFMNSTPGYQNREPATSYFSYRRIQLGDESNKPMTPVVIASKIVGLAVIAGSVIMSVKRKNAKYLALLLAPTLFNPIFKGRLSLPYPEFLDRSLGPEISYSDALTGIALPMVEGALQSMTYTTSIASAMAKADALPEPIRLTAENARSIPNGESILQAQQEIEAQKAADIQSAFADMLTESNSEPAVTKSSFIDRLSEKADIDAGDRTADKIADRTADRTVEKAADNAASEPAPEKADLIKQIMLLDSDSTPAYQKDIIVANILDSQPAPVAELLKQIPASQWPQQLKTIGMV